MNPTKKNYGERKHQKIDKDDASAMTFGVEEWPIEYDQKTVWKTTARDMVRNRLGIVTGDMLMKAAKAKQRYETQKTRDKDSIGDEIRTSILLNTPYNGREGPFLPDELPDLSSRENEKMLREVAIIVFNSSQVGDTIQTMADKVVLFCAYISNNINNIYLSDEQIMSVINTVFKTHNILIDAYQRSFDLLNSLNIQLSKRPGSTIQRGGTRPIEEFDGGYYKKNYRRSIKKKSRKLRSRQ